MHYIKTTPAPENNIVPSGHINYEDITPKWDDVHRYSPAPRHRRRLMLKMLDRLDFTDYLDVGCAQPFFMEELRQKRNVHFTGCDISEKVISSNRKLFPDAEFFVMDISKTPTVKKEYDLVTCSEVLEHVDNWKAALQNISRLCRRWLLITVPSGKVYPIDRWVGHIRHFEADEIISAMVELGFSPVCVRHWGFPFHSIYKYTINTIAPFKMYESFGKGKYGTGKRFISIFLYWLFLVNDLFGSGHQLIVLMEKNR